ncbi:MAG TPA: hypothetical protein VFV58_19240 [Blastocatellia bacterium]|nr:hypothetical protein [Blastocatellia bacterium]
MLRLPAFAAHSSASPVLGAFGAGSVRVREPRSEPMRKGGINGSRADDAHYDFRTVLLMKPVIMRGYQPTFPNR